MGERRKPVGLRDDGSNPSESVVQTHEEESTMFRLQKHSHNQPENDSSEQENIKGMEQIAELRKRLGVLSGRNLKFGTDGCLRRCLVARNWNVDKAKKMVEETLKWRSTYRPEEIRWHEVAHEGETGKAFRANFQDRLGRPVIITRPGMQNTNSPEDNVRHVVYLLENAILNLPEGQEQMAWLVDFTGFTLNTNLSVKAARDVINIVQSHYPERLGVAFLYNPPRIFQAFYEILKYFMDPKTSKKVEFIYPKDDHSVELMKSFFDIENLPSEFGGKATLKYDHQEFSRIMEIDDEKTAKFWGSEDKASCVNNGCAETDMATESITRVLGIDCAEGSKA